ncbi:MAG: hypothetical protein ACK5NA_01650 [Enterococcus sp.]
MEVTSQEREKIKAEVNKVLHQTIQKNEAIEQLEITQSLQKSIQWEDTQDATSQEIWLWDDYRSLDESAQMVYFVLLTPFGFIPGIQVEESGQTQINCWPELFSEKSPEEVIQKIQEAFYKLEFLTKSSEMNEFYNQVIQWTNRRGMQRKLTFEQQKMLHEDVLYSRELTELSEEQGKALVKLLMSKSVSLNFFEALDPYKKFSSENFWEVLSTHKRWLDTKNLQETQLHFVKLEKETIFYGVYAR